MKLLLDTDCDLGDVDDALCLDYLLRRPDCELLGITTVAGDVQHQARVASMLCRAAEQDVPIRPGAAQPLLAAALPDKLRPQLAQLARLRAAEEAVLERCSHQQDFPAGEAVELLRTTIRRHPGEVVLLCVAPLTNVALLLATDPDAAGLLRGIVLMCGSYAADGFGSPEWNASYDPHATAIVYRAAVALHRTVGFDVTCRTGLDAAAFAARRARTRGRPLDELVSAWFAEHGELWFHDPLTAAVIFEDDLCTFEAGRVLLDSAGETAFAAAPRGPHEVARTLDVARFHEHYFGVTR